MSKQQQAPGELEIVRAFVNTVDLEQGEEQLASPAALVSWLTRQGLAPVGTQASPEDLRRALGVREALRVVLLSHNGGDPAPPGTYQALDDAVCRAQVRLRFREHAAAAALESEADGVDGAVGRILTIVHEAIAQGRWIRLKACRERTCEWAFYDHTKNRSGAWCNMGVCGNRAKARAYRERHAPAEGPQTRRAQDPHAPRSEDPQADS